MLIWTGSTGFTSLFSRKVYLLGLLVILIDFMIFLSLFLDFTSMDVSVNSFFCYKTKLWISLPIECFPLTYDLNGFKSALKRHLLTVDSVLTDFLYALTLLWFFFFVAPCLIVSVQPRIKWIPIKINITAICSLLSSFVVWAKNSWQHLWIPKSSRLYFLKTFSANNFALSDAQDNI